MSIRTNASIEITFTSRCFSLSEIHRERFITLNSILNINIANDVVVAILKNDKNLPAVCSFGPELEHLYNEIVREEIEFQSLRFLTT
jgi:hypothetical protein